MTDDKYDTFRLTVVNRGGNYPFPPCEVKVQIIHSFLDPDAGDYHIGPGSAAIDAGVDAEVRVDIDNEPRPYQGYDLGADEYWPPGEFKRIYLPLILRNVP